MYLQKGDTQRNILPGDPELQGIEPCWDALFQLPADLSVISHTGDEKGESTQSVSEVMTFFSDHNMFDVPGFASILHHRALKCSERTPDLYFLCVFGCCHVGKYKKSQEAIIV